MTKKRHPLTRILDVQSRFFIPVWRRVALIGFCWGWAAFELTLGNTVWAGLFVAIGLYCAHQFFVAFDPPEEDKES